MPKNKARNPFYFFMKEMQEAEERKGCRIPMSSMSNLAAPLWAKLSLAEREPYEDMARMYKNDPTLRGGKLASDGTRVEDNLKEEHEKERLDNAMKQSIKAHVDIGYDSEEQFIDDVSRKVFYFISFNIMCRPNNMYMPNEVGLTEYSIRDGIMREYHTIIHPGRIPTGFMGEAKRLCEEKHGIDIFGAEENAEKDLQVVYNKIKSFINPDRRDEYPPLFTLDESIAQTKGCLEFLAQRAGDPDEIEVWNSVYLLLELRAGAGHPLPSSIIASDLLTKTCFQHHVGSRCEFHQENDRSYCALSYSKQLCYLISDATCLLFNVEPTERHVPARVSEEREYMIRMPQIEVMTPRIPNSVNKPQNGQYNWRVSNPSLPVQPPRVTAIPVPGDSRVTSNSTARDPANPRQPAGVCMATEFARLNLNMMPASVPGQGIGRGRRRQN